jgi:heat-inducible transcriptional repressor
MEPNLLLSERSRRILATLVREHIETGEPVASLSIVKRGGFGLSSATVRNIVARLEEEGYVYQPHTSAGRVPTDLGYRCYVDLLLEGRRPMRAPASVEAQLRQHAGKAAPIDVLATVSHMLSRASHIVGFALAPANETAALRRIEFVPLADTRVLVILVSRGGQVAQKMVDIGERLSSDELRQAANYLNTEFSGRPLAEVRLAVLERLQTERTLYDALLSRALRLARSSLQELAPQTSLFVDGASLLAEEASDPGSGISIAALGILLKMIEEKHNLVRLLTEYIEGPGLTVVIGAEHASPGLRNFSLVASTYFDGEQTGSVGVIGPVRMHYSRAISVVDGLAKAVSRVLRENP